MTLYQYSETNKCNKAIKIVILKTHCHIMKDTILNFERYAWKPAEMDQILRSHIAMK